MLTYLDFLIYFIFIPLLGFVILNLFESKRNNFINQSFQGLNSIAALFIVSLIALLYTTPWDNYLVATGVWFYEIDQIIGIIIGFVPIEEYTFFIVQTLLVGSIVIWGQRYYQPNPKLTNKRFLVTLVSFSVFFLIWIVSLIFLLLNFPPGRYFALIVSWSFPPIMLQLAFGADILWSHRKLVFLAILIPSLYLSLVDAYAIFAGIWTIAKDTSSGILIGNILPIEEMLFFFVTTILIVFGITLISDIRSKERLKILMISLKTINREKSADVK